MIRLVLEKKIALLTSVKKVHRVGELAGFELPRIVTPIPCTTAILRTQP